MDEAIVPREKIRQLGAKAFDKGRSINDHGMNPGSAAIADWQAGYRERQAEVGALRVLAAAMAMECPP